MEEGRIEVVLSKAIDLRLKISNCIQKATPKTSPTNNNSPSFDEGGKEEEKEGFDVAPNSQSLGGESLTEAEEGDEESERLLHIREALEALEHQLSSLQALQHQQRYEREVALIEIEHSRKLLLDKLKEYKGEDLDVIREASVFAGETVESNDDLLLPPYPSRPPQSLDNHYLSHFPSRKSLRNGVIPGEAKRNLNGSDNDLSQTTSKNSSKGFGHVIGMAARTVITVVGVISVLSLSGLGPTICQKGIPLKMLGLFQRCASDKKQRILECPPGRVLVMEDGEARCIVKERVAVPFESLVANPDVNYGCG